jgi:ABC-type polysaccharide/polyol phosphate export permease
MLARQDFFVRYRRASLGLAWAVGVPLIQTAVLVFVFTRLVKIGTVAHYPVFVLTGMLGWNFFAMSVQLGSTAIVDNSSLSSKIYFPRAVLPLTKVAANLYAFFLSLAILLALCVITGVPLTARLAWLVPGVLLMIALAAGFSLVMSALHVYSRDVRYIVQAALIAWFYVTPVFYSVSRAHSFGHLLAINPATGMVLLLRAATTGYDVYWVTSVLCSLGWVVVLLAAALALHRRFDRVFSDLL